MMNITQSKKQVSNIVYAIARKDFIIIKYNNGKIKRYEKCIKLKS